MSVIAYLKQRWYLLIAVFIGGSFGLGIYWASGSNVLLYALQGIGLCMVLCMITDFLVLRHRIKKMTLFFGDDDDTAFSYPLDKIYAKQFRRVMDEHKRYRQIMETQHASEIEFITKWVHDIKVPISAIRLMTDGMDDDLSQRLEMQTRYIEQNIQKILFHIKSKRFHEDYQIKQVGVKAMVSAALKQYAVFFSYKKIAFAFACEDLTVATDEKWSGYIVSQIISNAVKYTPVGGKITICAESQQEKVVIRIHNTGEGMDALAIKNAFKRGFSGSSVRQGTSTGYGLYLSKKLADIMGHDLYVQSVPKEYTEFFLVYNVTKMLDKREVM